MFTNYFLIAALISAAWLGLFAFYLYLTHQQKQLEQELEQLKKLWKAQGKDEI
jgi:CcmD family protein